MRVGQGFDVHVLWEGRPLIIGGVSIPHARGLLGHPAGYTAYCASKAGLMMFAKAMAIDVAKNGWVSEADYRTAEQLYEGAKKFFFGGAMEAVSMTGATCSPVPLRTIVRPTLSGTSQTSPTRG